MRQGESNMLIVFKGVAFALAVFVVGLIAFMILGRGGEFDTRYFTKGGAFLLGIGLGTSLVGIGLIVLGRLAFAHLTKIAG
jgi:hypothetical protein